MSKLDKFLAKPKEYTINGEKFTLKPLKVKNLDILSKMAKKDNQGEAIREVITLTLKESIPGATDDEIDNMGMNYAVNFLDAIIDVNGLEKIVDKKKLVDSLSETPTE
jgi:hypothetical protein